MKTHVYVLFYIKLRKKCKCGLVNNLRSVSFRAGKKHGDTMFSLSLQGHHYQLHHTAGLRLRLTKETKLNCACQLIS